MWLQQKFSSIEPRARENVYAAQIILMKIYVLKKQKEHTCKIML